MNRYATVKIFTFTALAIFALAITSSANAEDKGCSNASLKGAFAEKDTGYIMNPAPTPASLFAGVSRVTFDGKGNITAAGFTTVDGNGGPQTEAGTYTVNPDCTGTYAVQVSPGGFTAHAFFVIDDGGDELQIVVTDPGTVINCVSRRQTPKPEVPVE